MFMTNLLSYGMRQVFCPPSLLPGCIETLTPVDVQRFRLRCHAPAEIAAECCGTSAGQFHRGRTVANLTQVALNFSQFLQSLVKPRPVARPEQLQRIPEPFGFKTEMM